MVSHLPCNFLLWNRGDPKKLFFMLFNLLLQWAEEGEPGGVGRSWSVSFPPKNLLKLLQSKTSKWKYVNYYKSIFQNIFYTSKILLPDPPGGGWWPGDIWCLLCWGDPINIFSWAGDTKEPPVTEGWWTGEEPLLLPPIEWRPPNFGDGTGDCGTWPMPSELLLLDRGSCIPEPAIVLGPLLTVEDALLIDDAVLNWRRLFADVPRTTPDKVSISFLLGHGL